MIKKEFECKGKDVFIYKFNKNIEVKKTEEKKEGDDKKAHRILYEKKPQHAIWFKFPLPHEEVIEDKLEDYRLYLIEQHEQECDFLIHWTSIARVASMILTFVALI